MKYFNPSERSSRYGAGFHSHRALPLHPYRSAVFLALFFLFEISAMLFYQQSLVIANMASRWYYIPLSAFGPPRSTLIQIFFFHLVFLNSLLLCDASMQGDGDQERLKRQQELTAVNLYQYQQLQYQYLLRYTHSACFFGATTVHRTVSLLTLAFNHLRILVIVNLLHWPSEIV